MAEDDAGSSGGGGDAKRQRIEGAVPQGTMPEDLRDKIEKSLRDIGEVDYRKRSHHGAGPVKPRVLPPEDLVHEKSKTIRKGTGYCFLRGGSGPPPCTTIPSP